MTPTIILASLAALAFVAFYLTIRAQHRLIDECHRSILRYGKRLEASNRKTLDAALAINSEQMERIQLEREAEMSTEWAKSAGRKPPEARDLRPRREPERIEIHDQQTADPAAVEGWFGNGTSHID